MTDKTYNGWTNYETWNVALWLDNDEPTYRQARSIVAAACEEVSEVRYTWETLTEARTSEAADALKEMVEELAEATCPGSIEGASFVSDLLRGALSEVDYREVAGHMVAEWEESAE